MFGSERTTLAARSPWANLANSKSTQNSILGLGGQSLSSTISKDVTRGQDAKNASLLAEYGKKNSKDLSSWSRAKQGSAIPTNTRNGLAMQNPSAPTATIGDMPPSFDIDLPLHRKVREDDLVYEIASVADKLMPRQPEQQENAQSLSPRPRRHALEVPKRIYPLTADQKTDHLSLSLRASRPTKLRKPGNFSSHLQPDPVRKLARSRQRSPRGARSLLFGTVDEEQLVEYNDSMGSPTYLDRVKVQFLDKPKIYNRFLDLIRSYGDKSTVPEIYAEVNILFRDAPELLEDFKEFFPYSSD